MTTDTDQLLATVREAFVDAAVGLAEKHHLDAKEGEAWRKVNAASAALDSLAAELEQTTRSYVAMNAALQGLGREKGEMEAELERVKAERDEYVTITNGLRRSLDKALSALRWYAERRNYVPAAPPAVEPPAHLMASDAWDDGGPGARARAAIQEIEG